MIKHLIFEANVCYNYFIKKFTRLNLIYTLLLNQIIELPRTEAKVSHVAEVIPLLTKRTIEKIKFM